MPSQHGGTVDEGTDGGGTRTGPAHWRAQPKRAAAQGCNDDARIGLTSPALGHFATTRIDCTITSLLQQQVPRDEIAEAIHPLVVHMLPLARAPEFYASAAQLFFMWVLLRGGGAEEFL